MDTIERDGVPPGPPVGWPAAAPGKEPTAEVDPDWTQVRAVAPAT